MYNLVDIACKPCVEHSQEVTWNHGRVVKKNGGSKWALSVLRHTITL